jgi:putative oxidoreductase
MPFLDPMPSTRRTNAGLLLIRLVLGTIFIAHGAQKVFLWGMPAVGESFAQIGIPLAGVMGPVVSLVELLGGVAILLGLLTRAAGIGIAAAMLGAILFAHLSGGFFAPEGVEFPLMLLAAAAALVVTGAGAWSLDAVLDRRRTVGAEATEGATAQARRASRA